MATPFHEKTVVVTGASSGIGRALAVQLAAQGAHLVLAARRADALDATADACRQAGGDALAVPTDVTDMDGCRALIDVAVDRFGRLDALVCNAGTSMWTRFDEVTDLSIFEQMMRVNYLGAVYCTHAALPHLKASGGLVVGVSSLSGKTGVPTRTGYAASKHAMQGFFDSLRVELRGTGVDVTVVSPGFVDTDIRKHALGPDGTRLTKSPRDETKEIMSAEACATRIVRAMARRERDVVMTAKGRVGMWVKMFAPGLIDRIAERTMRERNT